MKKNIQKVFSENHRSGKHAGVHTGLTRPTTMQQLNRGENDGPDPFWNMEELTEVWRTGQEPIYKMWAEVKGDGRKGKTPPPTSKAAFYANERNLVTYHGIGKCARESEKLSAAWVKENFADKGFGWFLEELKSNGGKALVVPKGRAAGNGALGGDVSEDGGRGEPGGTPPPPTMAVVPSVTNQGDHPYCASYGLSSALRHCGYTEHAQHLEDRAEEVLSCKTSQAARAVLFVDGKGGWSETRRLGDFDPLSDRSPHPTIVQLNDSDNDNTHVVGIAGEWIFDSNKHEALPLTRESFNACCLGDAPFKNVAYAVRFVPGKKLKRKRGDAGA